MPVLGLSMFFDAVNLYSFWSFFYRLRSSVKVSSPKSLEGDMSSILDYSIEYSAATL